MMTEMPVSFTNQNGETLTGILHLPEQEYRKQTGINILNPGIKNRVSPNRLNVKLARRLCGLGYPILRFDPAGVGESSGELPRTAVKNIWVTIQEGLFVGDVLASNRFFRDRTGIQQILLAGNCGGAISGLLTSEQDDGIAGLILIDVPVVLEKEKDFAATIVPGRYADMIFRKYVRKLWDPEAWLRFLTLKTDYRALARAVWVKLGGARSALKAAEGNDDRKVAGPPLNERFILVYRKYMDKKGRILFILSENDAGTPYFENRFAKHYLNKVNKAECEVIKIKDANHIYALKEWQEQLMDAVCAWVTTHFPS
jgi:pimeloyl-ACP methyl ester carboxylesterase